MTAYDVQRDGARIGRIYLDLHPREGKFKHAAQFTLVDGLAGRQLAEGVLVCNFSRGLMEHDHVVTLFHEFGHLLHHVLAGAGEWTRFAGVATEWDFVEAPSQMLEEWAWDADVLADLRDHRAPVSRSRPTWSSGCGRPTTSARATTPARRCSTPRCRTGSTPTGPPTSPPRCASCRRATRRSPTSTTPTCSRASATSSGYSSAYYTYMWSLVIAKDLFSAFDPDDLFAPDVAGRYRDRVLAPGGTKDAADLVADFLGRPYTFDAYAAWLAR